jgi:hypothetical protein
MPTGDEEKRVGGTLTVFFPGVALCLLLLSLVADGRPERAGETDERR